MRVGVVGASNCILDGNFTEILRNSPLIDTLDNLSLGGSTSVILPYAHLTYELSNYDLIIVDFMINEYTATKTGSYTTALGMKMMRTFLGDLHRQGIPTIFTIMPHKQALAQDEFDFLSLYKAAAEKMGSYVIDMTQAAMAAMMQGISPDQLWADETHISPALHRIAARRVLLQVMDLQDKAQFQVGAASPIRTATQATLAQPAAFVPSGEAFASVSRKSSLCAPTYLRLPIDTPISFYAPLGAVYAIAYNSIQFAGKITVTSEHESAQLMLHDVDVETLTHKPGFDFRHRVMPFAPVRAADGGTLAGEITFTPGFDCPAQYAEVQCIYGGPLAALPVPNSEHYFEDAAELELLLGPSRQNAA